jgi:peptide deformylase
MQIIKPLDNRISTKVKNWGEIKEEASELMEVMKNKQFDGYWDDAFAISHTQVSKEPKRFFVINEKLIDEFGSWCIVNLEILKKYEKCLYPEACMSFPYRKEKSVERYAKIKVRYFVPFLNMFLIPKWKTFKNLNAFICQHEYDHSCGKNIYDL